MNEVLPLGIKRSRAVPETLVRIVSYSATRLVALFLTVVVVVYLRDALVLRLGFAERMNSDTGSRLVRNIILDRLPATLLLFVSAELLLFFASIFLALSLSRRYGSTLDRAVIALAPTSAAPAWFYGIFLILIFAALLRLLPFGGMIDAPPPQQP